MHKVTSFKAQYRQAAPRAAAPPRPSWEPLSPVLRPAASSAAPPAGGSHLGRPSSGRCAHGGALHPHTHGHPAHARAQPSPPPAALEPPSRRPAPTTTSPPGRPHPTSERPPKHAFAPDPSHAHAERPSKRARSEHQASPTHGTHHSRPATSHIPGYHVEQMMDTGMRMYHDHRTAAPQQSNGGDKMLSDAELLLFFSNVSAHTAQTPPSRAKRWRMSHTSPPAQPRQQTRALPPPQPTQPMQPAQSSPPPQPEYEPLSPQAATAHTCDNQSTGAQDALDLTPPPDPPCFPSDVSGASLALQTQTPPEETASITPLAVVHQAAPVEEPKSKKQQVATKSKPRASRSTLSAGNRKRSMPKPNNASSASTSARPDQVQSPQSPPADQSGAQAYNDPSSESRPTQPLQSANMHNRRHSFSISNSQLSSDTSAFASLRAQSVPLGGGGGGEQATSAPVDDSDRPAQTSVIEQPELICAACKSSESEVKVGDGEQWIGCDGCKEWHHYACAGFNSEREVRDVNKFYCDPCRPKFGETTKVRKSVRAHTTVDYAGLNEGVLKTSDDNPEHHYIAAFKNGDIEFAPETFARMPPELITADFLEKSNGFKEPILVPGALNTRTSSSHRDPLAPRTATEHLEQQDQEALAQFELEPTMDVGQDKLDMVIPEGLTVRRVAELYGPNEPVPVIDVKAQEGSGKKWTMGKWADYYEQQGEKPVRNVISLEVSRSRMGRLIRRPKAVRDMDLQDSVWREDDKFAPPPVQFYCLMSVADCFTDFHIDFGGSSVYYHIVKGRKVFFFIPPTKQNLRKYEDWCLSPNQGHDWLGKQVKDCYRVDLFPGDTMLIPSGWIHAVWTPEDSLVIGGNFLTRIHYGMQIRILEIEKNTKVAMQFRYPFFQKIMWLTVIKYLEEDPVPDTVRRMLERGEQIRRSIPIYCEPDKFGHNSHLGPSAYNARYYSKHELEGVTELLNYIWRTVLISLDKIDVPQRVRGAVSRSIPKGHGDPLALAKRFAMWIAWKRGNETLPSWALPDATLPEIAETGEKKLSAAQVKKMERDSLSEALRATAERSSARIRASDATTPVRELSPLDFDTATLNGVEDVLQFDMIPNTAGPLTGFLRPSANNTHITTPKTSQLGPKRVACDACRKRRIRCKHKDELIDTSKPGMHTIDLSGSYGISVKRRLSDYSVADGQATAASGPVNGGPIMADVNGDPYALKSGRVKACADCRKSKRRCIHDEYGNVDPIKANEIPIPRGSASKRRRVSNEDSGSAAKRMRQESSFEDDYLDGDIHARHSLPNQFNIGSSLLQDIAFSAQQALARDEDDLVPVDPALQAYANGEYSAMDATPSYETNGNGILSSIEQQAEGEMPMDGLEYSTQNGMPDVSSIEPLTPGPPPHNDTAHVQTNGYSAPDAIHVKTNDFNNAVRRASSPVSPGHMSPSTNKSYNKCMTHTNDTYNFTTDSDFPPPPITPAAKTTPRSSRPPNSSGRKTAPTPSRSRASKTPKSTPVARRPDASSEGIKLEAGLGMGGMKGMNMMLGMDMIDPSLDQASLDLIKQLQAEDLGLRRRSR